MPERVTWEYKIAIIPRSYILADQLSEYGADGWELVAVDIAADRYFFKRRVS